MIGFRTVLVHEYVDIDKRVVYETLQNQLGDLRRLSDLFNRFL